MNRASKAFIVFLVFGMGIWGCAQGPVGGASTAERLKTLEGKCAKLEEEQRTLASTRDQLRKKLAESEDLRTKAQRDLEECLTAVKERDELRQQVNLRTSERDALQNQIEHLRKSIRGLLSQVDSAMSVTSQPVTSAGPILTPRGL
jgi:septal ring factor EnvC (AmiA/AmiB activator)